MLHYNIRTEDRAYKASVALTELSSDGAESAINKAHNMLLAALSTKTAKGLPFRMCAQFNYEFSNSDELFNTAHGYATNAIMEIPGGKTKGDMTAFLVLGDEEDPDNFEEIKVHISLSGRF